MTTPGGVPNLPAGALTLDTLAAKTQDMSGAAMKARAVQRFPSIMDLSTGLSPALDITPFGILTRIWAEVNSLVANADPADITSPDDLPELVLEFIEGLPVVGQFVELFAAILGNYGGTDTTLQAIQALFAPINAVVQQFLPFINVIPGLLALIFGGQATTNASVNAVTNGGFSHDFASNGVTGWTNLVGTLAVSSRGPYVQSATETVAYRSSTLSVDKYGAHMACNPSMRGVSRLGICADTTASKGIDVEVYRGFDGDALRLVTRASPTLTVVRKQADFIGPNRLSATTNVDLKTDGVSQFLVSYNGQPVPELNWTDGSGIVPHNSSHRDVVLTSNGSNRSQDGYYGPQISKVVSYGW